MSARRIKEQCRIHFPRIRQRSAKLMYSTDGTKAYQILQKASAPRHILALRSNRQQFMQIKTLGDRVFFHYDRPFQSHRAGRITLFEAHGVLNKQIIVRLQIFKIYTVFFAVSFKFFHHFQLTFTSWPAVVTGHEKECVKRR